MAQAEVKKVIISNYKSGIIALIMSFIASCLRGSNPSFPVDASYHLAKIPALAAFVFLSHGTTIAVLTALSNSLTEQRRRVRRFVKRNNWRVTPYKLNLYGCRAAAPSFLIYLIVGGATCDIDVPKGSFPWVLLQLLAKAPLAIAALSYLVANISSIFHFIGVMRGVYDDDYTNAKNQVATLSLISASIMLFYIFFAVIGLSFGLFHSPYLMLYDKLLPILFSTGLIIICSPIAWFM